MIRGIIRGHDVVWDETACVWLWADTLSPTPQYGGEERHCTQCGDMPSPCDTGCPEGHDPCLGHIAGASSACCGHGRFVGYINWPGQHVTDGWKGAVKLAPEENGGKQLCES